MWIDIIWMVLALYGIWKGWTTGLILSIFTALAWGCGILAALKLSSVAATVLHDKFNIASDYMPVISFIAVFVIIALVIYLIGKSLEKIIEVTNLGLLNKIAGAVLYVTIFTIVLSIFVWLIDQVSLVTPSVKSQSKTYGYINQISDFMINDLATYTPKVKQIFTDFQEFLENLSKQNN